MTNRESDDQWLDELLEQPAVLRERSFIQPIKSHVARIDRIRKRIFLSAAVCWIAILYLVLPAQFLSGSLQRVSNLSLATERLVQSLMELDLTTVTTQSGDLTILSMFLLGAFALFFLQLRRL